MSQVLREQFKALFPVLVQEMGGEKPALAELANIAKDVGASFSLSELAEIALGNRAKALLYGLA